MFLRSIQYSADPTFPFLDCVLVSPTDYEALGSHFCSVGGQVFLMRPSPAIMTGTFAANALHRIAAQLSLDRDYELIPYKHALPAATALTWEVRPLTAPPSPVSVSSEALTAALTAVCDQHPFMVGRQLGLLVPTADGSQIKVRLGLTKSDPDSLFALTAVTEHNFTLATGFPTFKLLNSSGSSRAAPIFRTKFNVEELGIGGLDAEFKDIFRRAFSSRLVPPKLLKEMGQHHIKGMLLYGPPGCGKTLIARQIGKLLNAHPPKIVNGPELLNKYVGQSEENVRALFKEAEEESAAKGDDSQLHIIILDEMDAICKRRGSEGVGAGVNDTLVNQFLSKIDGVEALNNILLIGMTNRKELIDDAILRPGRLELHIEIGLPDAVGRSQILGIHTAGIRKARRLAADVDLRELTESTKNYTGAEIEGVVRAACSYAFTRQVDMEHLERAQDFRDTTVTRADFTRALAEIRPAFGSKEDEIRALIQDGIVAEEDGSMAALLTDCKQIVTGFHKNPLTTILLTGPRKSGRTALAAHTALSATVPFVRRISAMTLLRLSDEGRAALIAQTFDQAHRVAKAVIILDDMEQLVQWSELGARYNNTVLQTIITLLSTPPDAAHNLLVIATALSARTMDLLGLTPHFTLAREIPLLTDAEVRTLLTHPEFATDLLDNMPIGQIMRLNKAETQEEFMSLL